MGIIGRNQNSIDKNEPNSIEELNGETVKSSQYHEDFHENVYGDIDDLLGLEILETCYESPEESCPLKKDASFYHDSEMNMSGKLITINSFCSETSSLKQTILEDNSNSNYSHINLKILKNRSFTKHRSHSLNRSQSTVKRSSSYTSPETQPKLTIFTEDDYKFLHVIRDEEDGSSTDSPVINSINNMNDSKNSISNNNTKSNDLISPISATVKDELVHRNSLSNFFSNHFKGKKSRKKEEYKSNPELMNNTMRINNNSFTNDNYDLLKGDLPPNRQQRSNTVGSIFYNSPKRSIMSINKRSSFVDIKKQNYPVEIASPLSPLSGRGFNVDPSPSKKLDDVTNDIDSILVLADEKENIENNNNNNVMGSPQKIKKLENKTSSSTFLSHLKRRKERKSVSSLSCITTTDIMQRKKSFVYSAEIVSGQNFGSTVLPSTMTVNQSFVLPTQNSNSQIIVNEELLHSPKLNSGKPKDRNDFYQLPDYSDLIVMSESDIDGLYNTMVNDNQNHKKKSKLNISVGKEKDKEKDHKDKEKDLKEREYAKIIPLKTVEDKDDYNSPISPASIVLPVMQSNKDDPLRKSYKMLNDSYQMGSIYDVSSPRVEEKRLALNIDDDNILVVINPYGIRDIDFSTRRVLPVTNKENCSEDVDDLFNLDKDDKYKSSVIKLTEMEANYKHYKNNSDVVVNDPDLPNDIDDLFVLSSDLEKKMSVMDSLIVIDDIQENVRPDISELIGIADKDENGTSPPRLSKNNSNSSTSTPVSTPKNFLRRLSKSFSSSSNRMNSKVIENTPLNVEGGNYKLEKILTPKNVLVIPSYTEFNKSNDMLEKKSIHISNMNINNTQTNSGSNNNLLNNKNEFESLSKSCFLSNDEMTKNTQSTEKINSPTVPRQFNAHALNYLCSLSKSFSNEGLMVIRSNESMIDEKNKEEKTCDYIYYNRDNDKRRTRKGSVMDDFIELSTVNYNTKKKIINDSESTFKTALTTVKDYYDTTKDESIYGSFIGSNYSIHNNSNAANYYRQRDRLIASTDINKIKNELYYNDNIHHNNGSLSITNLKAKQMDVLEYSNPNIFNSSSYYSALNATNSLISIKEDCEKNDLNKFNPNAREIINEANRALANNSLSMNNTLNQDPDINYYFHITNIMNDSVKKNQGSTSLEVPQFTTGYNVSNTYISRMYLASSIDIFNRLEALNRSNSLNHSHKNLADNKHTAVSTSKLRNNNKGK